MSIRSQKTKITAKNSKKCPTPYMKFDSVYFSGETILSQRTPITPLIGYASA